MKEFFHMGGYGLYIWGSYGLALVLLVWNYFSAIMHRKQILQELSSRQRREKSS